MGAFEARGRWCFQAKDGRGVDNRLADGLTRWDAEQIPERLNAECSEIAWKIQELRDGDRRMCSEILRGGKPLEELLLRLEGPKR